MHKRRSSVNFGGLDIFARKCIYEKLIKYVAKTGFEIQSYIPRRPTHEMKNRILSKNKGCLFFLLPKIYKLPEYYMMFARKKYFFSRIWGRGQLPPCPRLLRLCFVPGTERPKGTLAAMITNFGGESAKIGIPTSLHWHSTP